MIIDTPHPTILIAEDDLEDRMLTEEAFAASHLTGTLQFVEDGAELLQYLRREGAFTDPASSPTPGIIVVDLDMPRMSGREAIAAIKGDASLRRTPLVVLTGSTAHEDIADSYDKGVASFITKPETFDGLVATVHSLRHYWFGVVQLPQ